MTPTPEQVAQWAREAGMDEYSEYSLRFHSSVITLVNRAMAEQAEADANLVEEEDVASSDDPFGVQSCIAAAIRANAPKVTK